MSDHKEGTWHENKLCSLTCCECRTNVEELKPLVRNAQFVCAECGRAAASADNLCKPVQL